MLYTLRKTRQDKTALVRFIPGSSLVSLPIGSLPAMLLRKNETKRNETITIMMLSVRNVSYTRGLREDYERICQDRLGTYCRVGLIGLIKSRGNFVVKQNLLKISFQRIAINDMEIKITVEAAVHLDQPGLLLLRCSRRPHLRPVPNNATFGNKNNQTLMQH
jgi:hypothetical protein